MKYNSYRSPAKDPCEAKVSILGFGGMRFPRTADGAIDRVASKALIDRAIEAGINYFDTAWPYHGGTSEGFYAEALAPYPRESYFLADKMPGWLLKEPGDEAKYFEEQLVRCNTTYFDFYLCHALTAVRYRKMKELGVIAYLEKKKAEGKIRRLGFSFHDTPAALEEILSDRVWDFAQIQYNYLDYTLQDAKGEVEALNRHNTPFLIMEPVRGGALANLPEKAAAIIAPLTNGRSAASEALRFAMSAEGCFCVLSGMTERFVLEDNIATAENFTATTEEEKTVLFAAARAIIESRILPCTACRYCDGCPAALDIPGLIRAYNGYMQTEDKKTLIAEVSAFENLPSACIACGACAAACPQRIDIPAAMATLAKLTTPKK